MKVADRYSVGRWVAVLGIVANIVLLVIKLIAGYLGQSQAMIADGFNSIGDVFASAVTLMGSIYAAKPKDEEHVFGHGKAEYLASMIIGFSMIAMAVYSALSSATALVEKHEMVFSLLLVIVAVITIMIKTALFAYCACKAKATGGLLISANAQDHRNDVIVSAGTLAAILLSRIGAWWADGTVGLVIAGWIAWTGLGIIKSASNVLMDANAEKKVIDSYTKDVSAVSGIDHVDSIVAKPVGAKYIVIVKVSVDRNMTVECSHEIAYEIKVMMMRKYEEIEDVLVHINPDLPHEEE